MKRWKRIVFELLGPPFIGTVLMVLFLIANTAVKRASVGGMGQALTQMLPMTYMILVFAYVLSGLQSVLYTVIMEWRFRHGLNPASWRSVGLSSFLGFCSGAVIILVFGLHSFEVVRNLLIWGGLGLAVGFIMGLLIKVWSRGRKTSEGVSP